MLAVYGNLTHDTIVETGRSIVVGDSHDCQIIHRAGGIANFARAWARHDSLQIVSKVGSDHYGEWLYHEVGTLGTPSIEIVDAPTTRAVVWCNRNDCTRTGFVEWGVCRRAKNWQSTYADWHHLMYIDRIALEPNALKEFKGTISADVCSVDDPDSYMKFVPYLDYLIVSEMKSGSIVDWNLPVRRGVIAHSPTRIRYKIKGFQDEFSFPNVGNLNVIGAGDYFSAFAISNLIIGKDLDVKQVHDNTLRLLRDQS
jgi:sugar/nucleoside kinase (ribokinase family)